MDLSKAYDCIPHDLIIAKLSAYGVDNFSLSFIYNYLSNRKQRVKINDSFSDYVTTSLGVPQGSILGPLIFNIFINDLLFFPRKSDLCNFADDNSLYASAKLLCHLISILKQDIDDILFWFKINQMVANPAKFQVMFMGTKEPVENFLINDTLIPVTDSVKLLGIIIDKKLNFKCHTEELCKKASNKTKALFRIRPYISLETAKALYHAYILSTFKYCPLIWMDTGKANYERLVKVHRRALSAVHQNFSLNFSQLLTLDNGVSLHVYFIRTLMTEIFKAINGLSPVFVADIFELSGHTRYFLRSGSRLCLPPAKTVTYGTRSLNFMGSLLWNRLPKSIKDAASIVEFKNRLKGLSTKICFCPICND